LEEMQGNLFTRALSFREENTVTIDSKPHGRDNYCLRRRL